MNNFVFSQDPLLYNMQPPQYIPQNDMDIKRQLDAVLAQYQALQQKQAPTQPEPQTEDYVGALDEMVRTLDPAVIESLNTNQEFIQINNWIQQTIQIELMKSIKQSLNTNQEVISKVNRAKDIIREVKINQETEDRRSLNELNDYITNYSDMTFNEYKQFKLSKQK